LAAPDADDAVEGENRGQLASDEEDQIGSSLGGAGKIGRDARRDQDEVSGGGDGRDDQLRARGVAGADEMKQGGPTGADEGGDEEVSGVPEGGDADCGSIAKDIPARAEHEDADVDQRLEEVKGADGGLEPAGELQDGDEDRGGSIDAGAKEAIVLLDGMFHEHLSGA
jgi:hypothetical protein